MGRDAAGRILLERQLHLNSIEVTGQGLRRASGTTRLPKIALARFELVVAGHRPAPATVARSEADGYRADVAAWGPIVVLTVTHQDGVLAVIRLDEGFTPLRAITLGSVLGREGEAVLPSTLLSPSQLHGPVVVGGELVNRVARLLPRESDAPGRPELVEAALELTDVADAVLPVPSVDQGPYGPLAETLRGQLGAARPASSVAFGLSVDETWMVDGREVLLSYQVEPGEVVGRIRVADTGAELNTINVDGEGHPAEYVLGCSVCGRLSCSVCAERARPCDLCGLEICRTCGEVDGHHRCTACRSLRPLGGVARRLRHRGATAVAVGESNTHHVAFVANRDGTYEIQRQMRGRPPLVVRPGTFPQEVLQLLDIL